MHGQAPLEVLIVEDEILLAAELGFLVRESGCRDVGHAMSSDEAVELAASLKPDLALVDVHLSDGPTGVEVARLCAALGPRRRGAPDRLMSAPALVNAVGAAAAICSMTSFAPQIAKIWKERDASAISSRTYAATVAAFALWVVYGLLLGSWPVAVSNGACLAMAGVVLSMKLRFSRPR